MSSSEILLNIESLSESTDPIAIAFREKFAPVMDEFMERFEKEPVTQYLVNVVKVKVEELIRDIIAEGSFRCFDYEITDIEGGAITISFKPEDYVAPCPYCTAGPYDDKPVQIQYHNPNGGTMYYFVHCFNCKASGPVADSKIEAKKRYNNYNKGR